MWVRVDAPPGMVTSVTTAGGHLCYLSKGVLTFLSAAYHRLIHGQMPINHSTVNISKLAAINMSKALLPCRHIMAISCQRMRHAGSTPSIYDNLYSSYIPWLSDFPHSEKTLDILEILVQ